MSQVSPIQLFESWSLKTSQTSSGMTKSQVKFYFSKLERKIERHNAALGAEAHNGRLTRDVSSFQTRSQAEFLHLSSPSHASLQ